MPDAQAPPEALWSDLDSSVPIALLPVRLETRYGTRSATGPDGTPVVLPVLRVRIYPDDISISASGTGVTPVERDAAKAFWDNQNPEPLDQQERDRETVVPGTVEHRRRSAWEVLVRTVGAGRAGYVARSCKPGAPPVADLEETPRMARLLPDSWVIVGGLNGQQVFATHVPRPSQDLPVSRLVTDLSAEDPLLVKGDRTVRWLTDFDSAVDVGMAAVIDLATVEDITNGVLPEAVTAGLDSLVVVGVSGAAAPAQQADALTALLASHADDDRAAFVAPGTPTNNLTDQPSGWTSDGDIFAGYARVVGDPPPAPAATDVPALRGGATDGEIFEAALGLPAGVTAGLDGSGATEQRNARNMSTALFPVTIGEVIGTLNRPAAERYDEATAFALMSSVVPFAREHWASFVRGRGPLPVLRIGRQPYGILPITSWTRWLPLPSEPAHLDRLGQILRVLRPCWEQAARHVNALTADTANSALLGRIMMHGPVPHPGAYRIRGASGLARSFLNTIASVEAVGADADPPSKIAAAVVGQDWAVRDIQIAMYRDLLAVTMGDLLRYGQLQHMRLDDDADPLTAPVAATNTKRPGWETPAKYLGRLAKAHPADEHRPRDLLFVLVEHALARAGELDIQAFIGKFDITRFNTIMAVVPEVAASTLSAGTDVRLAYDAKVVDLARVGDFANNPAVADISVAQLITTQDPELRKIRFDMFEIDTGQVPGLDGTRQAVLDLSAANLTDADYTRLTGETLACAANRLDAWVTSIAAQRLSTMRDSNPTGVHIGGWGLLVDVRPWPAAPIPDVAAISPAWPNIPVDEVPAGWAEALTAQGVEVPAVVKPDRQVGYVHAPSLTHAVTAGILRAAELAHRGDGSSLASIDLTSSRVRAAQEIIQSMSNGQPFGALLGYRLERALGHLHPDAITALRKAYPQRRATGAFGEEAAGDDAVVPAEVVDGYEVFQHSQTAARIAQLEGNSDFQDAIDELKFIVDAVADVVVAEGVHTISSGRHAAAGALFKATAEALQPPELSVGTEPRNGTTITNKVIIGVAPGDGGATGWTRGRRAALAPAAERWAQSILGPAAQWVIGGEAGATVALNTLGLSALDVLEETYTDHGGIRVFDARLGFTPTGEAYEALVALAGSARAVLANSRPLVPADVSNPETAQTKSAEPVHVSPVEPPSAAHLAELRDDVVQALTDLADAVTAIVTAASPDGTHPDDPAETGLFTTFAEFGLPGSRPAAAPTVADAVTAAGAAGVVIRDVDTILDRGLQAVPAELRPADPDRAQKMTAVVGKGDFATLVEVVRRIGGDAVVPTIEVHSQLGQAHIETPGAGDAERWLTGMSRVRRAIAGFDDLRLFAEADGTAPDPLTVYQFPLPQPGDGEDVTYWLGGPTAAVDATDTNPWHKNKRLKQPHTHIVAAGDPAVLQAETVRGFVVDESVETIPFDTATTGAALHYDAPNARAPQSILLAVHPDPATPWDWRLLVEIAQEALALAKIRIVELDDLAGTAIDEYFPLTYVRDDEDPNTTALEELTKQPIWLGALLNANRMVLKG
ncbi:hypothetical protein ASG82_18690 [Mycobacterium sp. Soil538]|nr:hypothetical protein ASG82_18690 [Mycobacterium sp. Soil538]